MTRVTDKSLKRARRHRKIRSKIEGTSLRPRLSVFKSNTALSAQLIDDVKGHTLASVSTASVSGKNIAEKARSAGKELAKKALAQKIEAVVFDRGGYLYSGQIQALAEGAREGGLKF